MAKTVLNVGTQLFQEAFVNTSDEYGIIKARTQSSTSFMPLIEQRYASQLIFLTTLHKAYNQDSSDASAQMRAKIITQINEILAWYANQDLIKRSSTAALLPANNVNEKGKTEFVMREINGDPASALSLAAFTYLNHYDPKLVATLSTSYKGTNPKATAGLAGRVFTKVYQTFVDPAYAAGHKGYNVGGNSATAYRRTIEKIGHYNVLYLPSTSKVRSVKFLPGTLNGPIMVLGALSMFARFDTATVTQAHKNVIKPYVDSVMANMKNLLNYTYTVAPKRAFLGIGGGFHLATRNVSTSLGLGITSLNTDHPSLQMRGPFISSGYDGYILMALKWISLGTNTSSTFHNAHTQTNFKEIADPIKEFWRHQIKHLNRTDADKTYIAMALDPSTLKPVPTGTDSINNVKSGSNHSDAVKRAKGLFFGAGTTTVVDAIGKTFDKDHIAHKSYGDLTKLNVDSPNGEALLYTLGVLGDGGFINALSANTSQTKKATGSTTQLAKTTKILSAALYSPLTEAEEQTKNLREKSAHRVMLGVAGLLEAYFGSVYSLD